MQQDEDSKRYLRNTFKLFHIFLLIKNRKIWTLFSFHGSFVKIIGKFIYDTNKKLRERLTRANERKKVNQCYNQNEDELRPRSLTVECMERPPRRPRPTPRHSKSLKFNREQSQQSEGNYNFTSGMPSEYYLWLIIIKLKEGKIWIVYLRSLDLQQSDKITISIAWTLPISRKINVLCGLLWNLHKTCCIGHCFICLHWGLC